jgi:hypothetical protein
MVHTFCPIPFHVSKQRVWLRVDDMYTEEGSEIAHLDKGATAVQREQAMGAKKLTLWRQSRCAGYCLHM